MPEETDRGEENRVAEAADRGAPVAEEDETGELPEAAVDAAERLTRLARDAVDENEAAAYRERRDEVLAEHAFRARVRGGDETLVLHPAEWMVDDTVRTDRIDDTDRAYEIPLTGADVDGDWKAVEAHNDDLVDAVEAEHGAVHAANARVFADFMGNHYVRRMDTASRAEVTEFLSEYYPRNAWPSKKQESVVRDSVELVFEVAEADVPEF
ncbi:rnhA operon protein [Halogeometricum sp. S1BR25-6]|uniref:RnhA operon protein n=1 Tax=Halogeometricum salsisoli TaxID=2950536 RepID=A0ABU2GB03_9EURY|nr:rnhA operon protein [Halogeometricum sp. S1BR25-6]MDS0297986.1 rnhA operon protein [Halogeometricum sp. S1BR25-6]